jgi:hypothetical protein
VETRSEFPVTTRGGLRMRDRWALLLLLLPVLAMSMGARRSEPMYMPPPIQIPEGMKADEVSRAIQAALSGRGWAVDEENVLEGESVNAIVATLYVRVHTVTIRIEFDDERIQIHYVRSTEMGYMERRKKEPLIHPKYTQWLKNLESDIKGELR